MNKINAEMEDLKRNIFEKYHKSIINEYIEIGDFTYGHPNIVAWDDKTSLKIGKFCSIADDVTILLGGEHQLEWNTTYPFNAWLPSYSFIKGHPSSKGNIIIENDVWIGHGTKILSGVTIQNGSIIGANSLVVSSIKPYSIYAGNPAKFIRNRFSRKYTKMLLEMKWWNWNQIEIYNLITLLQSSNIEALYDYYKNNIDNIMKG